MENNIIHFNPNPEFTVDQNIASFIDFAKNRLNLWGNDLDWDSLVWDITGHFELRGRTENVKITWVNLQTCGKNIKKQERVAIQEPLLSFAKAYIRYSQSHKKRRVIDSLLAAFRILEVVLLEQYNVADIKYISPSVLNSVYSIIKERYARGDSVLLVLNELYLDVCNLKMSYISLPWKKPKVEIINRYKTGSESQEYIRSKCPTDASFRALARIFCDSDHKVDKLVSSLVVIMLSQPCRIAEVLTLPYDCEVENINGLETYGLRWRPCKGGDLCVKQILDNWVGLVKQAIVNIKDITSEARKMAVWYEQNPEKIYLPEQYESLHDAKYIETDIVRELLSYSKTGLLGFLNSHSIKLYSKKFANLPSMHFNSKAILKSDLDQAIKSHLPPNFPFMDVKEKQKYSASLFIVTNNFFNLNTTQSLNKVMLSPVIFSNINISLGGKRVY